MKKLKKVRKVRKPKKRKRGVPRVAVTQYIPAKNKVIDYLKWYNSGWNGISWIIDESLPYPILGLNFEDIGIARMIFKQLKQDFGPEDEGDEIRISVIRGIDKCAPFRFTFHITQRGNAFDISRYYRYVLDQNSDSITMRLGSAEEFNDFISNFQGEYGIAPAITESNKIIPLMDCVIRKRTFHLIDAWQVHPEHEDSWAITDIGDILVPDDVKYPPIKLLDDLRKKFVRQLDANLKAKSGSMIPRKNLM